MKFRVEVMPKEEVLDPQGVAVEKALKKMQFADVSKVRIGKAIDIEVSGTDAAASLAKIKVMAEKLLCNSNVERFKVSQL